MSSVSLVITFRMALVYSYSRIAAVQLLVRIGYTIHTRQEPYKPKIKMTNEHRFLRLR